MTSTAVEPVSPARGLFALSDPHTPDGQLSASVPFGLSVAQTSAGAPVDLSGLVYDPVRQVSIGADGAPAASKDTFKTITTNEKTIYDHTSRNDANRDTYRD
jgi:putative ATP-grasp target RiPP